MKILGFILILAMPLSAQEVPGGFLAESEIASIRISSDKVPNPELRLISKEGDRLYYIALGNKIVAKQISSRKALWEQQIEAQDLNSIYMSSKVVVVTSADNFVFGLDKATGKLLWSYGKLRPGLRAGNREVTPKVAISDKTAYISYDNSPNPETGKDTPYEVLVLHISLIDGKILWRKKLEGSEPLGMVFMPEQSCLAVIMRTHSNPDIPRKPGDRHNYGRMYFINSQKGGIIKTWTSSFQTGLWNIQAADKRLIVTARTGDLFVFNIPTLNLLENVKLHANWVDMVDYPYLKICAGAKKMALWNAYETEIVSGSAMSLVQIRDVSDGKLLKLLKTPKSSGRILDVMCDSNITRVAHSHGITSWSSNGKEQTLEKNINYVVDLSKEKATVITDRGMEEIIFPSK